MNYFIIRTPLNNVRNDRSYKTVVVAASDGKAARRMLAASMDRRSCPAGTATATITEEQFGQYSRGGVESIA